MTDLTLFEVEGRLVDGWGNDRGEIPVPSPVEPFDPRAALTQASQAVNLDGIYHDPADTGTGQGTDALDSEGEGPGADQDGDGVLNLDEMNGEQLKVELKRRQEAGRSIDSKGIKTVGALRDLLKADDAAGA